MSPSPYALHEPIDVINDEVAWLQGAFVGSLLCGVQTTLSVMSFLAVLKQRMRRRLRIALLVFIFFLCAIVTIGQQASLVFVQIGFIQLRNYPGGPNGYLSTKYASPISLASTILFFCANWMMDSLLVWRCKVVCRTGENPWHVGVIIPSVLLVSEYVTGSLFLCQMIRGTYVINYTLAYTSLSLLLNIAVTGIIAGRLFLHQRRMLRQFGPGHGSSYSSVAAILIESASLYTCFLILFILFSCVASSASNVLQQVAAQVQCISALLIIYRIAQGKGWSEEATVTSVDWRGDTDTETPVQEIRVAIEAEPARADGIQAPQMSDKNTPVSSINATLVRQDSATVV